MPRRLSAGRLGRASEPPCKAWPSRLVPVVFFHVPAAAPAVVFAGPFAASPAAEQRSIYPPMFGILEHALAPFGTARVDAQHFVMAVIRIDAEGVIVHSEADIAAGQFLQLAGDIDVAALGTVLRTEDDEFAGIMIAAIAVVIVSDKSAIPAAIPMFVAPIGAR